MAQMNADQTNRTYLGSRHYDNYDCTNTHRCTCENYLQAARAVVDGGRVRRTRQTARIAQFRQHMLHSQLRSQEPSGHREGDQ
jgi:hypothetical protein